MIIKNESKIIKRCLESAKNICDYMTICDTGSTDGTCEIVTEFFEENKEKFKGYLYKQEWKNFGHNRSLSLDVARKTGATYILCLDADMILEIKKDFDKSVLTKDSYYIAQQNGSLFYYNSRLLKSDLKWECIGVTHEYYGAEDAKTRDNLISLIINDIGDGGCKDDKFERDIRLLEQGLLDEPDNVRYMFYLAQSYSDIGNYEKGLEWYIKRIACGGWYEEVYYSYYRIAKIYKNMNKSWEEIKTAYMDAWKYLPSRAEPLYEITKYCNNNKMHKESYIFGKMASTLTFPKDQVLFLFKSVYDYKIKDELSIAAYWVGKYQKSVTLCEELLSEGFLSETQIERVKQNMEYGKNKLDKKFKLCIGLLASLVNDKYKDQITGCRETWIEEANKLNVPVEFYCGNIKDDNFNFVNHLEGVKDDYSSATYKQYYGLKNLLEKYDSDFYLIAGTDNYINVERCLEMIKKYNSDFPCLIGGYGETRNIFGYKAHYMTGGSGLFLSRTALIKLAPLFDNFIKEYYEELKEHKDKDACDVSLCHFAWKENVTLIKEKNLYFCDWIGRCGLHEEFPRGGINYDKMITCHYMDSKNMKLYDTYKNINYEYAIISRKFNKYINEHKHILYYYAQNSSSIILNDSDDNLLCVFIKGLLDNLNENNKKIAFTNQNTLLLKKLPIQVVNHEISDNFDLLFLKYYENIEDKINSYSNFINKWIIIYDTNEINSFETFNNKLPDFNLEHRYIHSKGLTILKKI